MKKMMSFVVVSLLWGAAGLASAGVHYECPSTGKGKCVAPTPPVPPAPPPPPQPPAPPFAAGHGAGATLPAPPAPPALPAMPAPPAPPAPPAIPDVPQAAHAACAGKPDGSQVTHVLAEGETMTGRCELENGKPVFYLRSYHRN